MASDKDEMQRLRDENTRLLKAIEQAGKDNDELRGALVRAREENQALFGVKEAAERLAAENSQLRRQAGDAAVSVPRPELKPGNVWVYTRLRYVVEVTPQGGQFRAQVVPPGELIQVPRAVFDTDQMHRYPHLESEGAHDAREAARKKQHVAAVDGELEQIQAGYRLAEQMAEIRRQQQQVTAQQLVDAQRLGAQMPQGPVG